MRIGPALVLATLLCTTVSRAATDCLFHFGNVSDAESDPVELVPLTYGQLWEELKGDGLGVETIAAIISSRDPYTVPGTSRDHEALRGRLSQFKAMVELKGWNNEAVTERLIDFLNERATMIEQQTGKLRKAIRSGSPPVATPIPQFGTRLVMPDGRVLVIGGKDESPKARRKWKPDVSYSPLNGDLLTGPTVREEVGDAVVSPDGHRVFYSVNGMKVKSAPYVNGLVQWNKAKIVDAGIVEAINPLAEHHSSLRTGGGAKVFAGGYGGPSMMYDIATGNAIQLEVSGRDYGAPGRSGHDWGVIPGTDTVFNLTSGTGGYRLDRFKVDANGKLVGAGPVSDLPFLDEGNLGVEWKGDASGFLAHGKKKLHWVNGKTLKEKPLLTLQSADVVTACWSHDGKYIAVLVNPSPNVRRRDRTQADAFELRFIDPTTKETVQKVKLPLEEYNQIVAVNADQVLLRSHEDTRVAGVPP